MTLNHEETLAAVAAQDPPITPGQRWRISEDDGTGTIVLELRVLCPYPLTYPNGEPAEANGTRYLVMERCQGTVGRGEGGPFPLERLPEYNLRRLFTPVLDEEGPAFEPDETGLIEKVDADGLDPNGGKMFEAWLGGQPAQIRGTEKGRHATQVHPNSVNGCAMCAEIDKDFPDRPKETA